MYRYIVIMDNNNYYTYYIRIGTFIIYKLNNYIYNINIYY